MSSPKHHMGPQFQYRLVEGTKGVPAMDGGEHHEVTALHPETGEKMGHLTWDNDFVDHVSTMPSFRRQGVATGMWNYAHSIAKEGTVPAPKHSPIKSEAGQKWADSVGGEHG